jgi:hypothetical protein
MNLTAPEPVTPSDVESDPRLTRLAATLAEARRHYERMASRQDGFPASELHQGRQRYAHAALRYCAALQFRGVALPHGLPDTARWLLARNDNDNDNEIDVTVPPREPPVF